MSGENTASVHCPYKGLASYTEEDTALFFGRRRERDVVIANVKARRLTLLYGASGVGKSSLLRAGVASRLIELARENVEDLGGPEFIPVVFAGWRDDPIAGLVEAIREAVAQCAGKRPTISSEEPLDEVIDAVTKAVDAYLLVILDQFEEYFLYHPRDDGATAFAAQFVRAINHRGLQAGFLVSIRDDALAKLDRFKREIPNLFDTSLRVTHLDAAAARDAIVRPVEYYNEMVGEDQQVRLQPALVEAVLEQVRTGAVVLEGAGQGALHDPDRIADSADRIETPYLQLVMTRLWERARRDGSRDLRPETLAALGGAQNIVRTHLDAALDSLTSSESDAAADLFHHLVTPSGSKIAHAAGDLAEYTGRPETEVRQLLGKLAGGDIRIVRPLSPPPGGDPAERFEIFHDVLAPSVLDWRRRRTASRRAAEERRKARAESRRRLTRVGLIAFAAAFAAVAGLALVADSQRRKAERADALSRELAAFNVTSEYRTVPSPPPGTLRVKWLRLRGSAGTRVAVACSDGLCGFSETLLKAGGMRTIDFASLRDKVLPVGTQIHVLATQRNIGRYFRFTVEREGLARRLYRCRPPGSRVSPDQVPARCPRIGGPRPQVRSA